MTAPAPHEPTAPHPVEATLEAIAREHLAVPTLQARNADALDFHSLGVWQLREALMAAYRAGQAAR